MAEHSMCQPGLPCPHGDGHDGSPALPLFHSAKSLGLRFSLTLLSDSAPSPSSVSLTFCAFHGVSLA